MEAPQADVNIFLEVIAYNLIPKAKRNWLIPNPEWFAPSRHQEGMPAIEQILCKTKEAERIFSDMFGPSRVLYLGFESADFYDPSLRRIRKFLHVAGQSWYKNSQA